MEEVENSEHCLISVIVPVYNAAPYLKKCIESLREQTLKEWEAIFINDGSTDESKKIIEDYVEIDSRIRIINKDNEGVSAARNAGLAAARAPFITMLDADDYFSPCILRELYAAIVRNDCGMACCKMKRVYVDGREDEESSTFSSGVYPATPTNIYKFYMRTPWGKLYRRDIIERYRLVFPYGISICEDDVFVVSYWSHISSFAMVDKPLYNYLQSESSVLRRLGEGRLPYAAYERALEVPILIYEHLCSHVNDEQNLRKWCSFLIRRFFYLSIWMQKCCNNPDYAKSLKLYERKRSKAFQRSFNFLSRCYISHMIWLRGKCKLILQRFMGRG